MLVYQQLFRFSNELLRQELKVLRDRNLRRSSFEERAALVTELGIKILPSEDLKSRKIFCRLNPAKANEEREHAGFAKVNLHLKTSWMNPGMNKDNF
jgi:hypothetical protein